MRSAVAAALLLAPPLLGYHSADDPSFRQLLDEHRWFELRDAIGGRSVPPLYAGAVAVAFHQTRDAERLLRRAVRDARTSTEANEARELLAGVYMRASHSAELVRTLDEMLAAAPDRSELRNVRNGFEGFRRTPDQTARLNRRPLRCTVTAESVAMPATVNGKSVEWLFDSGFSHTSLSESEARNLGITVSAADVPVVDFSAATSSRTAVAERIEIGGSVLEHVPLLVFSDAHPMWSGRPPGRRGIVALPLAIALGGISWTRNGTCRAGGATRSERSLSGANLAFDSDSPPVTPAMVDGRTLLVSLDTGAQSGTQFWKRFADEFPDVVGRGIAGTAQVQQIGGRRDEAVTVVRDLRFRVAGFDATLSRARVFEKSGGGFQHADVGIDVFSQADEVSFDFRAMTVRLR